jgi:hypothetical protein
MKQIITPDHDALLLTKLIRRFISSHSLIGKHRCKGKEQDITFLVNKENWTEQPWQWDASTTQLAPRIEGFGGNPIFSNMAATANNKPSPPRNHEEPCW